MEVSKSIVKQIGDRRSGLFYSLYKVRDGEILLSDASNGEYLSGRDNLAEAQEEKRAWEECLEQGYHIQIATNTHCFSCHQPLPEDW